MVHIAKRALVALLSPVLLLLQLFRREVAAFELHRQAARGPKIIGYTKKGLPICAIAGGSVDGFIPTVWSARLLSALRKAQVFVQAGIVNRDYEGEISQAGDAVRIGQIGDVTINTFTKNTDINAAEALTDAQMTLLIDQGKYFNFQLDDVDRAQIRPALMDEAMSRAAYKLKDAEDAFVAALYTDATGAIGSSGSPKTDLATAGQPYTYFTQMAQKLDEQNVPSDGRWCVIPPWLKALMLLDKRFVEASEAANTTAKNGIIGEVAGITILTSNNVSKSGSGGSGATYRVMAGHPMAISFAEQVSKTEAYRPPLRFADAVKGLLLYGGKVVRPDALVTSYLQQP